MKRNPVRTTCLVTMMILLSVIATEAASTNAYETKMSQLIAKLQGMEIWMVDSSSFSLDDSGIPEHGKEAFRQAHRTDAHDLEIRIEDLKEELARVFSKATDEVTAKDVVTYKDVGGYVRCCTYIRISPSANRLMRGYVEGYLLSTPPKQRRVFEVKVKDMGTPFNNPFPAAARGLSGLVPWGASGAEDLVITAPGIRTEDDARTVWKMVEDLHAALPPPP